MILYLFSKLTFIARAGWAPSRWGTGLTVLLEKIAGIALVNKLRAILLFEADSNMLNSFVFGRQAMEMAREHNLIPHEQFHYIRKSPYMPLRKNSKELLRKRHKMMS